MKIVITTSGLGKRLGNLTKYTNKSLVRVGNKYPICYIIEKYPKDSEFIITLGYYSKFVKDFLLIAYPELNFTFVSVDKYEGSGSSLGYSLLQVKKYINSEFIYHCCDCIFDDDINIDSFHENTYYVYKAEKTYSNANLFSSVNVNGEYIYKINNKGFLDFDYIYIGVAFIKNYDIFFSILDNYVKCNKYNESLSDMNISQSMIYEHDIKFKYKVINRWYDMGTIVTFNNANKFLKCDYNVLHKDSESLCFLNDKVIKFFYDKEIVTNRVLRGNLLYPLTPKILNSNDNYYVMEKINGSLLSEKYEHGEINRLLNWAKNNLWVQNHKYHGDFKNTCYKFYYTKTFNRIDKYINNHKFEFTNINNLEIGNIKQLIEKIDFNYLCDNKPYKYHGDFILDNILKTDNGYCLLDWRQEFGGDIENGDIYYDLAKLRHNIIFNHKNIENGLFTTEKINNLRCNVDIKCNYFLINQLKDYDKFVLENNLDLRKIKILTSLIWINMAPLHEYKLSEFLFHFGKYNLFIVLNDF